MWPVIGTGVDVADVARVARELDRDGEGLAAELLSPAERAAWAARRRPAAWLALRFAAKEACVKALGTGKVGSLSWRDLDTREVSPGCLAVTLTGEAARAAVASGCTRMRVTLACARGLALAWAVADSPPPAKNAGGLRVT